MHCLDLTICEHQTLRGYDLRVQHVRHDHRGHHDLHHGHRDRRDHHGLHGLHRDRRDRRDRHGCQKYFLL